MFSPNEYVFGLCYYNPYSNTHESFQLSIPERKVRGHGQDTPQYGMPMKFTLMANEVFLIHPERKVLKYRYNTPDSEEANDEAHFIGFEESHRVNEHELIKILSAMFKTSENNIAGRPI